jgi:hypothetical protein
LTHRSRSFGLWGLLVYVAGVPAAPFRKTSVPPRIGKITARNLRVLADELSAINYQLDVALPRITSSFAQVWIFPQCAQMNFCVLTLAVCQRFSSIVRPVSVSFDVEGQRTSKLLIFGAVFFGRRRGGSK